MSLTSGSIRLSDTQQTNAPNTSTTATNTACCNASRRNAARCNWRSAIDRSAHGTLSASSAVEQLRVARAYQSRLPQRVAPIVAAIERGVAPPESSRDDLTRVPRDAGGEPLDRVGQRHTVFDDDGEQPQRVGASPGEEAASTTAPSAWTSNA